MKKLMTKKMVAAIKRKDVKAMAILVLLHDGSTEEAALLQAATRLTVATIDRTCVAVGLDDVEDEGTTTEDVTTEETGKKSKKKGKKGKDVDPVETTDEPEKLTYADKDAEILTVGDIKALCKEGSKKSIKAAKKAFKEQFGKEHPNYKEMKKAIKNA